MARVISVVQCVGKKRETAQKARNLYTSPLFMAASAYAEKISDEWYIISAKYGLVIPSEFIEPYDVTLKTMSALERKIWAERVFSGLKPLLNTHDTVVFLAGVIYRENLVKKVKEFGCKVEIPMEGLRIGEQVSWLQGQLKNY
jgi:hypothetical protein